MFGLNHTSYAILAVALALLIDQIFDNLVTPRIIAQALRVHPAAVLVVAIIAANLVGLLGVILAAPMLATAALIWNYTIRKMLDLDPWPEEDRHPASLAPPKMLIRLRRFWRNLLRRFA